MPRFRNEAPEQSQYSDGDVVWVKIHNTEIWWPGEVTSTQDFRFVNSTRPPFAVVAFFNEKTFEHVRSPKLIYPFQCDHKEEFIKRGQKKAEGMHMADKFSDDVFIAESRFARAHHSSTSSVAEANIAPASRPDSLIKACLSSNSSSSSSGGGVQNSNARSSAVPSAVGRVSSSASLHANDKAVFRQQEPTFRIMDIGGGATPPPRDRAFECNMCSFRTNSMSVLLIHRRNHLESSSSFSSFSSSSTTTNTATSTGNKKYVSLYDTVPKTRASRRAHTTSVHDVNGRRSRENGVRCSSRHVSIVIDAPLTSEEQEKVQSIVDQTLASIELVVGPKAGSSAGSASASASNRKSSSSSSQVPAAESTRRSNAKSRDPRSQRSNQLRATMPAPQSPPSKQRRLTRSMSRRQQGASPVAVSPEILPPPVQVNSRRNAGRRCTLAAATSEPVNPPRRGNLLRKTMTTAPPPTTVEKSPRSAGRRKQPLSRTRTTVTGDAHISPALLISPSIKRAAGDIDDKKKQVAEPNLPISPSPEPMPSMAENAQPNQNLLHSQSSMDASKQLQLSLMAEWGDDETDESMEEPPQLVEKDTRVVKSPLAAEQHAGEEEQEQEHEHEKTDGVAAKKRIRNIPKKDRREVVVQEFHVQDSQPDADEPEVDEPIIIQDSDASSNGSVVFVEDEPRQRGRGVYPQSNGNVNVNDKATSSLKASIIPSCFDFEEEDDVQQQEGQNGLSYRRRTNTNRPDINGKGHAEEDVFARNEEPVTERELDDNVSYEYLFKGFEDVPEPAAEEGIRTLEEAPREPEVEPEPLQQAAADAVEPEEAITEDAAEGEAGDHIGLPIKERQKRIFKSRNKSTMACSQDEDLLPASMTSTLPSAHEEEVTAPRSYSPPQEANCVGTLLSNGEKSRRLSANNSNTNSSEGVLSDSIRKKRRYKSKTESSRRPSQRSRPLIRRQTPSPEHEELSNHSNSSSSNSSSNSRLMSSSSSDSHGIGTLSPEPSSSNSCSIASNIAVISAEEARELQRSASGAGLIHAAIVDATQPVQRGGVLILEDIRLPNLYEPSSQQSSDSNGSRQTNSRPPDEDDEQSQDTADQPETNDEDQEESQDVEPMLDDAEPMDQEAEEDVQQEEEKEQEPDQKSEEKPESEAENDLDPWSQIRDVRFLPQSREVLLKKREQELLRQYEADLVSGRSAEKCRQARARWSRTMPSPEEADANESDFEGTPLAASPTEEQQQDGEQEEHEAGSEGEQPELAADEEAVDETGFQMAMDMDIELEAVELVMPASLFLTSRRPASHPQLTPLASTESAIGLNRPTRHLSCARELSDADVEKAHQQLVDLREQQRLRFTPPSPPVVLTPPATLLQASGQKRQRRRSKNAPSDHVESSSRSEGGEESSSDAKDGQESPENPPQLCAGRICAVMTRPIPGYSHTFMLCSLNNNNFTPLNNVALYLDNEKNHLVPVPREALLEPPRLADGHPLSAVFADIDFLGGEAVAQVVEPSETEMETELELDQDQVSPRQLSPQMLLSEAPNDNDNENDVEAVDAMGIMTPLSQVAEGGAMPAGSYVNEEEELSLHEEQLQTDILQLNVNGYHLQLDPSVLFSMAEQPDTCIEVNVTDAGSSTSAVGGSMRAVLHARDILQAAEVYLQERDLQLVNVEDMTLDDAEADASSAELAVPATDLLSQALAGSQVVDDSDFVNAANAGVGLLHIDTRTGAGLLHVGNDEPGSVVFISHPMPPQTVHLTPPITARTNETNALLDQTPIMSTLENPSGMQLRRVSPLVEGNLEDSLAVIGVTNGSGVPTSLELPITVTNPAIASRMGAPVADMLQFAPFQ
ncbi:uncharacterized protein LOC6525186 isoform X1 [Drosophila yakuba]|uniref:uncharacterized protein LOC6525186 isoform X1 n=1 Tax=Drosophila yakuba TaxID=7245 RepID=UPI001930761C|nr:uncharacterized protein LOC6525186 isoform X1 [Drosophila yakuba]